MESKSSKTTATLVIATLLIILTVLLVFSFWKYVVGLIVGAAIGYYFGWSRGRGKKK